MSSPIYIFAGGGTGGHLYPALAVAERLRERQPDARIVFACSDRAIDRRVLDPTGYAIVPQPVRPMPPSAKGWGRFLLAYGRSRRQAGDLIADLRPAAVLGAGGFAAGPVVCRAAKSGIPAALLNPDAVPGKANRLLAKHVDVIFTQFQATADHFPVKRRAKVRCVGCPVSRRFFEAGRAEAISHFGLRDDRKTLLVNGGSLGARSINEAVAALGEELGALSDSWQVLHVTGSGQAGGGQKAGENFRVVDYCRRMDLAYAAADLTVGRCGAASVAELSAAATPAVLMPYPHHKDQHQRLNATPLAEAGAAVIVTDQIETSANAAALREQLLPLMRDPARLDAMRAAAGAGRIEDAAGTVAQWLLNARP